MKTRYSVKAVLFILCGILVFAVSCTAPKAVNVTETTDMQAIDNENAEDYSYFKLPNGIRIFIVEDHRVPLVTFSVTYNVGSIDEKSGISGISHFLEHVMFLGTDSLGKEEVFDLVRDVGGSNNAATSYDFTTYFAEVPSSKLELLVAIEADRMGNLRIDPDEFERERQVVIQERRQTVENNLWSSVFEELMGEAFREGSLNHGIIGWMEDIESITVEDMKKHYKQFYSPNNAVIVVSGDADPEEVLSLVKKYFGDYEPQDIDRYVSNEPPQTEERFMRIEKTTKLPMIAMVYKIPEGNHPDIPAIKAFLDILVNDANSRVNKKLKNQARIILGGMAYAMTLRCPGYVFGNIVTMDEKMMDMVRDAFDAEIRNIIENGIEDDELEIVKKSIIKREIFSQKRMGMLARTIGMNTVKYQDPDFAKTEIKRYKNLAKDDIIRVAEQYFTESGRTLAYIVPKKVNSEGENL